MFPEKLKRARDLLGLTQSQAAQDSRVKQPHISDMEKNEKALIPKRYIDFLYSRGIDLNTLFDTSDEVRLRSPEAAVPRIPAVEQILEANRHIQSMAGPPAWLREVLASQERIKQELKAEILKELLAAQKRGNVGQGQESRVAVLRVVHP